MNRKTSTYLLAAGVGAFLLIGPALAAENGDTSGPAAGSNTKPSTAVEKQQQGTMHTGQMKQGATGTGSPGVAAKPGTEAGGAPKKDSD